MEKSEISLNESFRLFDAPPVAFNINDINLEKAKNYKIIKNDSLSILSKQNISKNNNKERYKLKINISREILKNQDKNCLLEIINIIRNLCEISLISNNFIFKNSNLEFNKNKDNPNELFMTLKSKNEFKIFNNKKETQILTDYYCSNHKRYFKSNEALQNHIKTTHKFKCEKCGVYFSNKRKLDKHIINLSHQVHKNNNEFINKKSGIAKEINYPNNNIIINEYYEINKDKNIENKKYPKPPLKFEPNEKKEMDKKIEINKNKINFNKNKEKFNKKEEQIKKEKELKKLEEQKKKEEERKRQEELKRQEEERKRQEELKKKNEMKTNIKNQQKVKVNQDFYYYCYLDEKKFNNEKDYINHFSKYHKNDYPFYCDKCKKGFYSFQAIEDHNFSKNH